ncbi:MAG TPA: ribonuclease [Nostocaceae cyanobacterium]|nr:ribonuclease [Nostocaceae cyanobacterium]
MQIKQIAVTTSLLITSLIIPHAALAQNRGTPGKFDFYVLALSWSPDYCATAPRPDPGQCNSGKKLGFVLHGLWPQYKKGFPANCTNGKLPAALKKKYAGLFPSATLSDHEWEKHGTCSGKTPDQYLAFSKKIKESVVIPTAYNRPSQPFRITNQEFKNAFVSANRGFNADGIAPSCSGSGRFLQEVLICYSKDGQPIGCSEEILRRSRSSCGQSNFLVRSVR